MKLLLIGIATLVTAAPLALKADSYSVFRVCEDQHVLRTSDGAEAGHVEYIVVDPGQRRVVSTVITGGVIGEKHIAVPYASVRFGPDREVRLESITRERLLAAPVIETSSFASSSVVERTVIEPTFTHFSAKEEINSTDVKRTTTETERERGSLDRSATENRDPGAGKLLKSDRNSETDVNSGKGYPPSNPNQADKERRDQDKAGSAAERMKEQREQKGTDQRNDHQRANEQKANEPRANEQKANEPRANEQKANEPGANEQKANEQRANEQKANEPRVNEQKANAGSKEGPNASERNREKSEEKAGLPPEPSTEKAQRKPESSERPEKENQGKEERNKETPSQP